MWPNLITTHLKAYANHKRMTNRNYQMQTSLYEQVFEEMQSPLMV